MAWQEFVRLFVLVNIVRSEGRVIKSHMFAPKLYYRPQEFRLTIIIIMCIPLPNSLSAAVAAAASVQVIDSATIYSILHAMTTTRKDPSLPQLRGGCSCCFDSCMQQLSLIWILSPAAPAAAGAALLPCSALPSQYRGGRMKYIRVGEVV